MPVSRADDPLPGSDDDPSQGTESGARPGPARPPAAALDYPSPVTNRALPDRQRLGVMITNHHGIIVLRSHGSQYTSGDTAPARRPLRRSSCRPSPGASGRACRADVLVRPDRAGKPHSSTYVATVTHVKDYVTARFELVRSKPPAGSQKLF